MRGKRLLWLWLHGLIFFFSLSSLCGKLAASHALFSPGWFFFYGLVLAILLIYAIAWQQIIKRMPLSAAYANKAAAVIWGQLWGLLFFGETITAGKAIGALLIVAGIVLHARASGEALEQEAA
jgi:hypothetical protein